MLQAGQHAQHGCRDFLLLRLQGWIAAAAWSATRNCWTLCHTRSSPRGCKVRLADCRTCRPQQQHSTTPSTSSVPDTCAACCPAGVLQRLKDEVLDLPQELQEAITVFVLGSASQVIPAEGALESQLSSFCSCCFWACHSARPQLHWLLCLRPIAMQQRGSAAAFSSLQSQPGWLPLCPRPQQSP